MEQRYPNVKILALSMHNDDDTIMKMLIAGVNGYILKNADPPNCGPPSKPSKR
jgi:DNA-binding NarL/FixJ family response regulator